MIQIDKARALQLLEEAVAERGADYVYPHQHCDYAVRDSAIDVAPAPACIVGVALAKAGVSIAVLETLDGSVSCAASMLRQMGTVHLDDEAVDAWQAAQVVQDGPFGVTGRGTWGDALAAAKGVLA
jgi:hypothetical protein